MDVSYDTAFKNEMVHDVVLLWLRATRITNNKAKFETLRRWEQGHLYLVIDGSKLRRPLHYGHDLPYQAAYLRAQFRRGF